MKIKILTLTLGTILMCFHGRVVLSQARQETISYEDYVDGFLDPDDALLPALEEWQNVISQWLEAPLSINSDEADLLVEYKIISLYQLNKLKEYRLIYSDLLSLYELANVEGWDFQTVKKVVPLVTVKTPTDHRVFNKFNPKLIRQDLVVKTATVTQDSKGYKAGGTIDSTQSSSYYAGSSARFSMRYDLEIGRRIVCGLRLEKDPGEPMLAKPIKAIPGIKVPDMVGGYIVVSGLGPVSSMVLGNYRVSFGYGMNISGGFSGIKGRNGMSGMADRIGPHTSVSESGYLRGAAIRAELKGFSMALFGSLQDLDGSSVIYDTATGKPVSFSTLNSSGLHRSEREIAARKAIRESVAGGFLVYENNWLKTGIIGIYTRYNARVARNSRPYSKFSMTGNENLVAGWSATAWLPKIQVLTEMSVSRNKSLALLAGLQVTPVPGMMTSLVWRKFDTDYQNWHGAGFSAAGANSGETGFQGKLRVELPNKYLAEIVVDESWIQWVSYDLASPARKREVRIQAEKSWSKSGALCLIFSYTHSEINDGQKSEWICHPVAVDRNKLRLEYRTEACNGISLKSRVEYSMMKNLAPGWLIMQDIEVDSKKYRSRYWLRVCYFDVGSYDNRLYSYENDVLYDFSSFMHYGKGLRGLFMVRYEPSRWLQLWLRLSTIYYTNKYVGSGWDAIEGNRQNEIEIQARLRWPD